MSANDWLAEKFEENRGHLRAVAYRMLGSLAEADDAVQEAWLRLGRSRAGEIDNFGGWLTTVVARICLDMLRSRKSRREETIDVDTAEPMVGHRSAPDPEQEALLADSVGLALLVVLDKLTPAERLAFVLHDMFAMPFEEIAPLVGRTPTAARQLASRARRRVQGTPAVSSRDLAQQREVANAFLSALHAGDFEGLMAVLDPDVIVRLDEGAGRPGAPSEIRGAANWARGAVAFTQAAKWVRPALIDGAVGLVWVPRGRLLRALSFSIEHGKITRAHVIANPKRLRELDVAILED